MFALTWMKIRQRRMARKRCWVKGVWVEKCVAPNFYGTELGLTTLVADSLHDCYWGCLYFLQWQRHVLCLTGTGWQLCQSSRQCDRLLVIRWRGAEKLRKSKATRPVATLACLRRLLNRVQSVLPLARMRRSRRWQELQECNMNAY